MEIFKKFLDFWTQEPSVHINYYPQKISNYNLIKETLNNSIAMSCINYIVNNIHNFSLDHNLNEYFSNEIYDLMEKILMEWMFFGNCFIKNDDGTLEVLKSDGIKIQGKKIFYYNQWVKDVIHLKNFNIMDDLKGISPLDAIETHIIQYNTINKYLNNVAGRGGVTSGLITCKTPLSNNQKDKLQQEIKDFYKNISSQGTIMVLEGDFNWNSIAISPHDLDIKKMNNYNASAIARGLGIHPILIGLDKKSFGGLQHYEIRKQFIEDTLTPLYGKIINQLVIKIKNQWAFNLKIKIALNKDRIL
jgi:HK97 family phage portal protein